jgi:sugar O-acyltransferase (sialic acid O-acetyltransferase NeuD family)
VREIIFWGATGQAKVLHEAIRGTDTVLVALVDNRELHLNDFGVPLVHGVAGLDNWLMMRKKSTTLHYNVAIGGGHGSDRLMLMDLLQKRGLTAYSIIHKTAFVADNAIIGEGCQILAQSAVCAFTRLGRGVIVNTAASVDHDCEIGDGVHLAPGVRLAGEVTIGARTFIGTGAIILPRIHIAEDVVVGAGAVVTRDVSKGITVTGNPAHIHSQQ